MLMRESAPEFKLPTGIEVFKGNTQRLDNGVPVHKVEASDRIYNNMYYILNAILFCKGKMTCNGMRSE